MVRATGQGPTREAATAAALSDLDAQYDGRVPVRVWTTEELPMFTHRRIAPVGWIVSVAAAFPERAGIRHRPPDRGPGVDTRPVDERVVGARPE